MDNFRHKGLRKKLIEEVRKKGIRNEDVLDAMSRVPRHLFMDSSFINFSYTDKAFHFVGTNHLSTIYRGLPDRTPRSAKAPEGAGGGNRIGVSDCCAA